MDKRFLKGLVQAPGKVFYGWWIVAVGVTFEALMFGFYSRGFTIYVIPIQKDLRISRAAISLAEGLGRLAAGLLSPVVGYLIDRLGLRRMLTASAVLMGLGFIILSFSPNYTYFLVVYIMLLATAGRGGFNNAHLSTVNRWFRRKRSLTMSLVSAGQGLGCAAITPLVALMVFGLGWQTSALISGIVIMVVLAPLGRLLRPSPESMGLLPDGYQGDAAQAQLEMEQRQAERVGEGATAAARLRAPPTQTPMEPEFTAKEAMKTLSYWLFVFTVGLRSICHSAVMFHLVPMMVWAGSSERTAAFFVSLLCFNSLVFNPAAGLVGDRWPKQRICAAAMVSGALSMVVLLYGDGQIWVLALFVFLLSLTETANPLTWAMVADLFGSRSFGTLRGLQQLPNYLMSTPAPVLAGLVFDQTGSYRWAIIPLAILYGLSAFFYWTLPRPKMPVRVPPPYTPPRG